MAKRTIRLESDELLRKKSREVTEFGPKLWELLDDMAETMYAAEGAGLAAVQVGVLRRAVVIDAGQGLLELINPVIIKSEGTQTGPEGCLSSPEEYGTVTRPMKVKVRALNRHGKPFEAEGEELLARAFCHEIDHLHGVLFKDLATEMLNLDDGKKRRKRR